MLILWREEAPAHNVPSLWQILKTRSRKCLGSSREKGKETQGKGKGREKGSVRKGKSVNLFFNHIEFIQQ